MKKYAIPVLTWLWGAALASAWWAMGTFGTEFAALPAFATFASAALVARWMGIHWDDEATR